MSKISYKFKIEKPCQQDWNEMPPVDGGKYCNNCQYHVIDFSILSDIELIQIIEKSSGKICGRLTTEQLEKEILVVNNEKKGSLIKLIASFLLMTTIKTINSENLNKNTTNLSTNDSNYKETKNYLKSKNAIKNDSVVNKVNFLFVDESSLLPISNVHISILKLSINDSSDINGLFEIDAVNFRLHEPLTLRISKNGYKPITLVYNKDEISTYNEIKLSPIQEVICLIGGIRPYVKKKKWYQFWK